MGFSQSQVAKILGLRYSNMVSRWEDGLHFPSAEYLLKLSVLYKTLPNELYYEVVREYKNSLNDDSVSLH
jgi:transcriptional regulator with XRE-family HTH domain